MMKSDGNGGVIIDKKVAVSLSLVILLIGALVPMVVQATKMSDRIDNLEKVWERVQDEHPKNLEDIDTRLDNHDSNLASINTKLDIMMDDLKEIKQELKEIRSE